MNRIQILQRPDAALREGDMTQKAISLLIVSSLLFIVFPSLDLYISQLFHNGDSFYLSENMSLRRIRDLNRQFGYYVGPAVIVLAVLYTFFPRKVPAFAVHKALFVFLTFLLGPLLGVQALKHALGRVRPRSLWEFGGTADFTPVWQFAGACTRNCSFPSGEAAMAAATLSLIVFVPRKWRAVTLSFAIPALFFISFNRVIFGAHFMSDVVLAWCLVLCIMSFLWGRIYRQSARIDGSAIKLGRRLIRFLSGLTPRRRA